MATPINVELVAPDRVVWEGEADMVIARTTDGELGVMANHIPLLGVLVDAPVRIRQGDRDIKTVNVKGGFLSVTKEKVSVLAESVEDASYPHLSGAGRALALPAADVFRAVDGGRRPAACCGNL